MLLPVPFAAAGILAFIRWMNRRGDPRHGKQPPDPPWVRVATAREAATDLPRERRLESIYLPPAITRAASCLSSECIRPVARWLQNASRHRPRDLLSGDRAG